MLGYKRTFRSDGCCRNCIATYEQIKTLVKEESNLLRSKECNSSNFTGLEQSCPFEDINSFYVVDNCSVDVFHDFNEGFLHAELIFFIGEFMKQGFFDVETLNIRKNTFEYYTISERKNMCVNIQKSHLKKKKLKMSGSEIATFFKYLPIFVGEFVPSDNETWKLLLLLYRMMNFSYKDSFTEREISELSDIISKHHTLYKSLTGKPLTFKHHVVTHYPTVITEISPPKKMSTIRMEGFHRISKAYTSHTSSRKNILLSLAEKHQYYHIHEVTKIKSFKPPQVHSEICNIDGLSEIRNPSFLCLVGEKKISYYKQLTHFDVTYKTTNVIKESELFLQIDHIVKFNENIYLVCSELKINSIDSHLSVTTVEVQFNCDHTIIKSENLNSIPYSCFEYNVKNVFHEKILTILMDTNF